MASNRSNFLGLHLQNDQTGTPGTYQRDDNVPLHLSSAGIKHETNWNNAINSLGGGDAPWFANDSIDGYPTDIKIVDDIALVSYGDYSETFSAELSLTSLKYGTAGFSSTFYDASTIGFRKADNPLPELGDKDEAFTGLWMDMPEDLTEAMEAEKVFDSTLVSRQIQQGNIELVGGKYPMHPKAMDLSGATVEIELDGNITSNNASQYYSELDGYKVTLSYGGAAEYQSIKVWDSGAEKYVTSACTEKSKAIGVRPGTNSPVVDGFNLKVEMYAERDYDINEYVHWDNGMDGKVFFGVNMSYVKSFILERIGASKDFELGQFDWCWEPEDTSDPESSYKGSRIGWGSLDVGVRSAKLTKTIKTRHSGKVEVYSRNRGTVSKFGTVDGLGSNEFQLGGTASDASRPPLKNGDKIKISCALGFAGSDPDGTGGRFGASDMDGIKYVKVTGSDGATGGYPASGLRYFLYDDENFINETNLDRTIRSADFGGLPAGTPNTAIRWAAYGNKDGSENDTWSLHQTLKSPKGPNGYVRVNLADYDTDLSTSPAPEFPGYFDGTQLALTSYGKALLIRGQQGLYSGFHYGFDADIKKWQGDPPPGTNDLGYHTYSVIVGEPGLQGAVIDLGGSAFDAWPVDQFTGTGTGDLEGGGEGGPDSPNTGDYNPDPGGGDSTTPTRKSVFDDYITDGRKFKIGMDVLFPQKWPHGRAHTYTITVDYFGAISRVAHNNTMDASTGDENINSLSQLFRGYRLGETDIHGLDTAYQREWSALGLDDNFTEESVRNPTYPDAGWRMGFPVNFFPDIAFDDFRNLYWFKCALNAPVDNTHQYWDERTITGAIGANPFEVPFQSMYKDENDDRRYNVISDYNGPMGLRQDVPVSTSPGVSPTRSLTRIDNNTHLYLYPKDQPAFQSGLGLGVADNIDNAPDTGFEVAKLSFPYLSNWFCFLDSYGKSVAVDIVGGTHDEISSSDGIPMYYVGSNVKTHITKVTNASTAFASAERNRILRKEYYCNADGDVWRPNSASCDPRGSVNDQCREKGTDPESTGCPHPPNMQQDAREVSGINAPEPQYTDDRNDTTKPFSPDAEYLSQLLCDPTDDIITRATAGYVHVHDSQGNKLDKIYENSKHTQSSCVTVVYIPTRSGYGGQIGTTHKKFERSAASLLKVSQAKLDLFAQTIIAEDGHLFVGQSKVSHDVAFWRGFGSSHRVYTNYNGFFRAMADKHNSPNSPYWTGGPGGSLGVYGIVSFDPLTLEIKGSDGQILEGTAGPLGAMTFTGSYWEQDPDPSSIFIYNRNRISSYRDYSSSDPKSGKNTYFRTEYGGFTQGDYPSPYRELKFGAILLYGLKPSLTYEISDELTYSVEDAALDKEIQDVGVYIDGILTPFPHFKVNDRFGSHMKYDDGILLTNARDTHNEFGTDHPGEYKLDDTPSGVSNPGNTKRLYVFSPNEYLWEYDFVPAGAKQTNIRQDYLHIIEKQKYGFVNIGRIAPAVSEKEGAGLSLNNITYSNNQAFSKTRSVDLTGRFDVVKKRIILEDGVGYAVFDRNTASKKIDHVLKEKVDVLDNYFVYNEFFFAGGEGMPSLNQYDLGLTHNYFFGHDKGISDTLSLEANETGLDSFVYFFNVPAPDAGFFRSITGLTVDIDVKNLVATKDAEQIDITLNANGYSGYLPALTLFKDDPRETITQRGTIVGNELKYGLDQPTPMLYSRGSLDYYTYDADLNRLGDEEKAKLIKYPVYSENTILGGKNYTGLVSLTETDLSELVQWGSNLTKSNYTRTFTYNDGEGNAKDSDGNALSYTWTLDDTIQTSYNSAISPIESTIALGFLPGSTEYYPYVGNQPEKNFTYRNRLQINSVYISYKDYDVTQIRPFLATFYEKHNLTASTDDGFERGSVIGFGKSQTAAWFDEDTSVLAGTFSRSLQILHAPQNETIRNLDVQQPEFLSLHTTSAPSATGVFPAITTGHVSDDDSSTLFTSGVYFKDGAMPLKIGPVSSTGSMPLVLPNTFGFECSGVPLYGPRIGGTTISDTTTLYLGPSGEGYDGTLSLRTGNRVASGTAPLYTEAGLSSGNIQLSLPSGHAVNNTIPGGPPELFVEGATSHFYFPFHLSIGQPTETGGRPLFMSSPTVASGNMNLTVASPISGVMPLSMRQAKGASDFSTTLWIGKDEQEKSMPLAMNYTHSSGNIPLHMHAQTVLVDSLADNFGSICEFKSRDVIFDDSSRAEPLISEIGTNSISRDKLLRDTQSYKNIDYGILRDVLVGDKISYYSPENSLRFFRDNILRESIDSNGTYLAIGTRTNATPKGVENVAVQLFEVLSDDSVKLKYTYDTFAGDLITNVSKLTNLSIENIYCRSLAISNQNRVAVSLHIEGVPISGGGTTVYYDAVVILELQDISTTTTRQLTADECAIEGRTYATTTTTKRQLVFTTAFCSNDSPTPEELLLNKSVGSALDWSGEDLYYSKQNSEFGKVYYRSYSDSFATETEVADFMDTPDYDGYQRNISFIDVDSKVAFGHKIKIYGDLMFICAPLVDPRLSEITATKFSAASLRGAVYMFTRSNDVWSYANAVYKDGYTASNVVGVFDAPYEAGLFGYDMEYNSDSQVLVVGQPASKKVHKFLVSPDGNPFLVSTHSGTSSQDNFGATVALCNGSNPITSSNGESVAGTVHNLSSGAEFNFDTLKSQFEAKPYVPVSYNLKSVSELVTSIRGLQMATGKKILVARTFDFTYGAATRTKVQKLTLLEDDKNKSATPFVIMGPIMADSTDMTLQIPQTSSSATGDLSLYMTIAQQTGSMPLYIHQDVKSGVLPLNMRGPTEGNMPLIVHSNYKPSSVEAPLFIDPQKLGATSTELYTSAYSPKDLSTELYTLGSVGNTQQFGFPLFIDEGSRDPIADTFNSSLFVGGPRTGGVTDITGLQSVSISGGNAGPTSLYSTLIVKGPDSVSISGNSPLSIRVDDPSGSLAGAFGVYTSGTGTSAATIAKNSSPMFMQSTAPDSGNINLVLFRRGTVEGSKEFDASESLFVQNTQFTTNINVYASGSYGDTGTMSLSIPSGIGPATGVLPLSVRGYEE